MSATSVPGGPGAPSGLARLRVMSMPDRITALLGCCASARWAAGVAARLDECAADADLFALAEELWWSLSPGDWREALDAHPKIGERTAAGSREGREQGAMDSAAPALREAIAEGNQAYEDRFGMTYVVRARGRDAAELLLLLRKRLGNAAGVELRVAAGEQAEITRLRLADLLAAEVVA